MTQSIRLRDLIKNRRHFTKRAKGALKVLKMAKNDEAMKNLTYALFFEQQTAKYADNTAIKYSDRELSYRVINTAANKAAHYLQGQGITQGDTVALFMENRPEFLIYQLAITKLGGIAALINSSQQDSVLIHSINLVNSKAVISGEETLSALEAVKDQLSIKLPVFVVPDVDTTEYTGGEFDDYINIVRASADARTDNLGITSTLTSDQPCWYIYTSGTTGLPKASVQTHKRALKSAALMGHVVNPLTPTDIVYSSLPLYHITALSACWFAAISNGASLALARKFSASRFWEDIAEYKATSFGYVGELCRYLLNQPESALEKNNTLTSMVGNGLRPEIWEEFKARFGIQVVNEIYGASEGNLMALNIFNLNSTVGMVMGSYKLVKFDQENEELIKDTKGRLIEAGKGEPGLLLGKIDEIAPFDGYSDKSKNDSKVINNAFKQGDSYFNTGDVLKDIGYKQLQFCDRTGDTYRWKGENVSTQQVEEAANKHASVSESVAYGVEIPQTNGKAGMIALKLEKNADTFNGQSLLEHLNRQLPTYAVPIFVRIKTELEKTPTFKYQKAPLKKEGFDMELLDGPAYVLLPGESTYQELTQKIFEGIKNGEYRF